MEVDEVRLDLKFDTTHTWNPRERVIISAMDDYLAKVNEEILVGMGELKTYLLCPTDVADIVDVLAKNAYDQKGRRMIVLVETKDRHLVAGTRQPAIMRARMESDYQELQVIIKHMNMKQKELLTVVERKQKLMSGAPEKIRETFLQDASWS